MSFFQRPLTRVTTSSPWRGLADELQRELSAPQRGRDAVFHGTRGVFPPVNLHQVADGYVLTAELPGVGGENIDIQIEGSTVTLSGQRKPGGTAGDGISVHRRERQFGTFRRAFELPSDVDVDRAKATHKNGVLTIALPKLAVAKPRQIEIETR